MVISIIGILLYAKISPVYITGVALLLFTRKLIVYKHCNRSLHIGVLDPTCVQNFRPVALTVFEIQGLKLNNNNNNNNNNKQKKNWRNGLFAIFSKATI